MYSYFYVNDKGFSEYLYIQLQYFWLNLEILSSLNPILYTEYKESRAELCHCQAVTVLLLTLSVVMEHWQKNWIDIAEFCEN